MHLALRFGAGIRILRQDLWEMLITFLISQNNNIPRIKKIIFSLCSLLGTQPKHTAFRFFFPHTSSNSRRRPMKRSGRWRRIPRGLSP
jgi:3-methyladenine DNA glycosylase/8-oxoguanine DNA glycosylase